MERRVQGSLSTSPWAPFTALFLGSLSSTLFRIFYFALIFTIFFSLISPCDALLLVRLKTCVVVILFILPLFLLSLSLCL